MGAGFSVLSTLVVGVAKPGYEIRISHLSLSSSSSSSSSGSPGDHVACPGGMG